MDGDRKAGFRDPNGAFVEYARRAHNRLLADAFYLFRQRTVGHAQAAQMTCAKYGHDARAGRCDRCGLGVTGAEARRGRRRPTR